MYCLEEKDFPSLRAYNDYLEEKEDFVMQNQNGKGVNYAKLEKILAIKELEFHDIKYRGTPYIHIAPSPDVNGPAMPKGSEMGAYVKNVKQTSAEGMAGGYLSSTGCCRALFEAHQDLYDL